jgi:hypothetical protein
VSNVAAGTCAESNWASVVLPVPETPGQSTPPPPACSERERERRQLRLQGNYRLARRDTIPHHIRGAGLFAPKKSIDFAEDGVEGSRRLAERIEMERAPRRYIEHAPQADGMRIANLVTYHDRRKGRHSSAPINSVSSLEENPVVQFVNDRDACDRRHRHDAGLSDHAGRPARCADEA